MTTFTSTATSPAAQFHLKIAPMMNTGEDQDGEVPKQLDTEEAFYNEVFSFSFFFPFCFSKAAGATLLPGPTHTLCLSFS